MPKAQGKGHCNRWWHNNFRDCGYRITTGRDAIVEVLTQTKTHLSAEDIYMRVHEAYPAIGLTSIYRTLEVLSEMALVSRFDFGEGRARYELIDEKNKGHHHHLVCHRCRKVIDYADFMDEEKAFLEKVEKGLAAKYDFDITGHVIQFHGRCKTCANGN